MKLWLTCLLLLILGGLMVISLGIGAVSISPIKVWQVLAGIESTTLSLSDRTIIWELRLPRTILACLVGCGLGTAGAGYQGLFRNPLADPFVIGASSGSALGATLMIVTGMQVNWLGLSAVPLAALAGSLLSVAIVYMIAVAGRDAPMLSLLLAGVAVSSFIGAVVSLLMFLNDERLVTIFGWLMGSFSGSGWSTLPTIAPLILIGITGLWLLSRPLDALSFGEEAAQGLGLRLSLLRSGVVLFTSIATAASVSAGGVIGFVGLISPHLARLIVGGRHVWVIPVSGLFGGILLVAADDLARTIVAPEELPVGVVTALLGSPFFLFLLKTRRRAWGAIT